MKPDVIALQEIGGTNALFELQASLKAAGSGPAVWELVSGADTDINVAVLSRLPIVARHPLTNGFFSVERPALAGEPRVRGSGHPRERELRIHAD